MLKTSICSGRIVKAVAALCLAAAAAFGQGALFPEPLHLSREIEDPITGTTIRIEEYAAGNRLVAISGDRVAVADYGRGELLEINRGDGTHSVISFAELARIERKTGAAKAASAAPWSFEPGPQIDIAGRPAVRVTATTSTSAGTMAIEVAVDPTVALSRDALEVLTGAAFPNTRSVESEVILRVAGQPSLGGSVAVMSASYGLPVQTVLEWRIEGAEVRLRNTVVRVGREMVPPAEIAIPAGSRLIESPRLTLHRMLAALEGADSLREP